jgi:hypothetical protein
MPLPLAATTMPGNPHGATFHSPDRPNIGGFLVERNVEKLLKNRESRPQIANRSGHIVLAGADRP